MDDLSYTTLKRYWVDCFELYKDDVLYDFNLVDWHGLITKITQNMSKAEADRLVVNNFNKKETSDPFIAETEEIPFNMTMLVLKTQFEDLKQNAKRLDNIYKQDYLYYGVLDFVNKVNDNYTKRLLGDNYPLWKANLQSKAYKNKRVLKDIYEYVKHILRQCKSYQDIKPLLKHAKDDLKLDTHNLIYKKSALKIIKLHINQERNGLNKRTSTTQNEYSFIIDYLSRIISIIFDIQSDLWNYKWGETKLGASKEEENRAKNDDDKRSVGASIDGIIYSPKLNLDILLLEVSDPMHKENYSHFLKDRLKIAKNLKKILKSQFRKSFVLSEMIKFDIPVQPISYAKELPLYIKNLMKMLNIVKVGYDAAQNYMINYDYTSDESLSGDE
ncbi:unnamed protein product [Rhizopus stolonifer]